MESWSTIRYRLGELHCPLLENLEDRKIGADLSGLAGDLRYNLLEWLFLTYDRSFYTKFIASDQSDSGRVQRRILSLIEANKKAFSTSLNLFTHPGFKTSPPEGLKTAEKELQSRCETLKAKVTNQSHMQVESLQLFTFTNNLYPHLSGAEFVGHLREFVELYDQSLEVWTKQKGKASLIAAPELISLEPNLEAVVVGLSAAAKSLDNARELHASSQALLGLDSALLDWSGLDETSLEKLRSYGAILEKSLQRRGIQTT